METMIWVLCCVLLAFVFTGLKEGAREKERQLRNSDVQMKVSDAIKEFNKWQSRWHSYGFVERFFIGLTPMIFFWPDVHGLIAVGLFNLWMAWVLYDGLTNTWKDLPYKKTNCLKRFFYSGSKATGTGSKLNQWIGENMDFVKFAYSFVAFFVLFSYVYLKLI